MSLFFLAVQIGRDYPPPIDLGLHLGKLDENAYRLIKYEFSEDILRLPSIQVSHATKNDLTQISPPFIPAPLAKRRTHVRRRNSGTVFRSSTPTRPLPSKMLLFLNFIKDSPARPLSSVPTRPPLSLIASPRADVAGVFRRGGSGPKLQDDRAALF